MIAKERLQFSHKLLFTELPLTARQPLQVPDQLLQDLGDCLMKIHLLRCMADQCTGHQIDFGTGSECEQPLHS